MEKPEQHTGTETWGAWISQVGSLPILFSACHEATHIRDGEPKVSEVGTKALAFRLATLVDAKALSTENPQFGDPNWDPDHPYVDLAENLLKVSSSFSLDIHMMKPRGIDACVGLGDLPEQVDGYWQSLVECLVAERLTVSINWPFSAGLRTFTSKLQNRGFPALQLELSTECFESPSDLEERVFSALSKFAYLLRDSL